MNRAAERARHPKIRLLFQPVYHSWVNHIEKLSKKLHDTVTRNHHHTTMASLMRAATCFMDQSQPFPGHHLALIRYQC
jgi:hypothetical protein